MIYIIFIESGRTGERPGETEPEHKNGIGHFSTFKPQSCWSTTNEPNPQKHSQLGFFSNLQLTTYA